MFKFVQVHHHSRICSLVKLNIIFIRWSVLYSVPNSTLTTHFDFALLISQLISLISTISFSSKIIQNIIKDNVAKYKHKLNTRQPSYLIFRCHTPLNPSGLHLMFLNICHQWFFMCIHNSFSLNAYSSC